MTPERMDELVLASLAVHGELPFDCAPTSHRRLAKRGAIEVFRDRVGQRMVRIPSTEQKTTLDTPPDGGK